MGPKGPSSPKLPCFGVCFVYFYLCVFYLFLFLWLSKNSFLLLFRVVCLFLVGVFVWFSLQTQDTNCNCLCHASRFSLFKEVYLQIISLLKSFLRFLLFTSLQNSFLFLINIIPSFTPSCLHTSRSALKNLRNVRFSFVGLLVVASRHVQPLSEYGFAYGLKTETCQFFASPTAKERKHILSAYRLCTVSTVSKHGLDWSAVRYGLVTMGSEYGFVILLDGKCIREPHAKQYSEAP